MTVRVPLALTAFIAAFSCIQTVDITPDGSPVVAPDITPVTAPTDVATVAKTAPTVRPAAVPQDIAAPQRRPTGETAEILVLGDSQISFGAGAAYTAFFEDLAQNCGTAPAGFARANAAAIGVRSTALHHWSARSAPARGVICDVDPTFGVNAGAYGVTSKARSYVQIGADPNYPFCPANQSPLEAVFDAPAFDPDLVVLAFLGNATGRWQSGATARRDWQAAAAQLPKQMPCIVMTTIPTYEAKENDRRMRAQANLAAAVAEDGTCAFVAGITAATRGAIQGNAAFFRTDASGVVTDPRHPNSASASRFIDIQQTALCAALTDVLPN